MSRHEAWDSGYMQYREITRLRIMQQSHQKQNSKLGLLLSALVISAVAIAGIAINNESRLIRLENTSKRLVK